MSTLTGELIEIRPPANGRDEEVTPGETPPSDLLLRETSERPPRPAWIEIDVARWRRNFQLINADKPASLRLLSVVKDEAYGHSSRVAAHVALEAGVKFLAVSTVEEAMKLRDAGVHTRLLLLGDRQESELPWCVAHDLTCCVSEPQAVEKLGRLAARAGKRVPIHLKINTGMNRYGVRWNEALPLVEKILAAKSLRLEGALSHFAQSDELEKTFALLQLSRFKEVLCMLESHGVAVKFRHLCNSGGYLDLPNAHFDMVRVGILPLGVFPSSMCRRIPGIEAVMSVRARIIAIQQLQAGDHVGYGMRYTATAARRSAVLPIGYGDGFPRVRNAGCALVQGRRAPVIGGVAMDALTVDITEIPEAQLGDEAVLMGRQGNDEISVHEVAKLKNSASYDVLCSWRGRLPRIYLNDERAA